MKDETGKLGRQWRVAGTNDVQLAKVPEHDCWVTLDEWAEHFKDVTCARCKKVRLRPQGAQADWMRCWKCDGRCDERFEICLSCVPVVLRTESKKWDKNDFD